MSGPITFSGTIFRAGTTAANAATDTYKDVGEVMDISEFGKTFDPINYSTVSNRQTIQIKGNYSLGTLTVQLGHKLADDGQAALLAALESDDEYNFQIELNDKPNDSGKGTLFTFKGRVMSFVHRPNASSVVGATVTVGISQMVSTTAPAAGTP